MSELIRENDNRATIRWKLLTGASALALTAYVSSGNVARAEDSDRPQIWIELGGQLSQLEDGQETFTPVFPTSTPARPSIFSPSQPFEGPPLYSIDEFGKISFQPESSDWIFSASIQYGRSAKTQSKHQQTYPGIYHKYNSTGHIISEQAPLAARFADTQSRTSEKHLLLDFQAGKDFGLGLFGADGSSVVSLGVRFAQFRTKSSVVISSDPDWHFNYKYSTFFSRTVVSGQVFHLNNASATALRSFRGIGPSLSWNASAPFAGNAKDGELTLDWTVNAALLFGRQKTKTHHQTTGRYHTYSEFRLSKPITFQGPATPDHTRSRNITVPNVGGSVGLTYRIEDFKVSFGYRADMFFGAIDGGIDTRKNENRAFYGPFASVSVGLGD